MTTVSTPLRIDELTTHDRWLKLVPDPDIENRYRDVTGWGGSAVPTGMSIILARLAFTRGRALPPGGVLLGIELDAHACPPADGRCEFRVTTDVTLRRSGHRFVKIVTSLRRPAKSEFAEVAYLIRWPHE